MSGRRLRASLLMMRSISILHRSLCATLLLLTALTSPSVAHNGAVAIAVPVEGIVVDGQFDDWPEGVQRWPVDRAEFRDRPKSAADYTPRPHCSEGGGMRVS